MYQLHQLFGGGNPLLDGSHHGFVAFAVNIGNVVAQTYVAALQHGIKFGQLSYNLLVEVEYTAVVLTQLLDCLRRYAAAAYELLHRTLGNPLRILHVTLATRELLDEIRIGKIQFEVWRQHTPY